MFKEKIKSLVQNKIGRDSKKTVENLVVFLVLLIITIVSINLIWGKDNSSEEQSPTEDSYKVLAQGTNSSNISQDEEYDLEDELEDILSRISGVGEVQVLITYSETNEIVAMQNETINTSKTEESDSERRNKNNRNSR